MRMRLLVAVLAATMLTAACGGGDDDGAETSQSALDVANLRAETDNGTVDVERIDNAFVGEVDDELFVGVAIGDSDDGHREVAVYLGDRDPIHQVSVWLKGEMNPDGPTEVGGFDDGAHLVFEPDGDDILIGIVTVGDRVRQGIELVPAESDAGVYRATPTDAAAPGGWVVLPDGRQRGHAGSFCPPSHPNFCKLRTN